MDMSFYTAAVGTSTQQERMNTISNNIANVNTTAFKTKTAVFQDLMYVNMRAQDGEVTNLTAGTGAKISHTNTDFTNASYVPAPGGYNYAISGEGFFMLSDPTTNEISYTRSGIFSLSERVDGMYLATDGGKLVLDESGNPIQVQDGQLSGTPGVYDFANKDGMLSVGDSEFVPLEKNGPPILNEGAKVMAGYLEMSNVDLATELANTIESSRAYSYVLKMVQVSDEVTSTVNSLRK